MAITVPHTDDLKEGTEINPLFVEEIDKDSDDVATSLGISKDRAKTLQNFLNACGKKTGSITASMELYSTQVKSANELVFGAFAVGYHVGAQDQKEKKDKQV